VVARNSSTWFVMAADQLAQASDPEGQVGRPVRLVKRPTGGADGRVHVGRRRVRSNPDDGLGGRVDVVERGAIARRHQHAIHEKALLSGHLA